MEEREVVLAILAKDKAHCISQYLRCIYKQDYPKQRIHLYIRTNNNNDDTSNLLQAWIATVKHEYASIHFDDSALSERVQDFKPHDWNSMRFRVLGDIRQESIFYALNKGCHYMVVDCDNFIYPEVLSTLFSTGLPVVGPLLYSSTAYSNYHHCVDSNGYFDSCSHYHPILEREIEGLIEVDVIHCTYLIRYEALKWVSYHDQSERHEYVRFSSNLRKSGIKQYLDTRRIYGFLTFADDRASLFKEPWFTSI